MKNLMLAASLPLTLLGACTTTADPERLAVERAWCERMEQDMGLRTTHDHQAMKGMGLNPMNTSHERCQQLLSQPQQ